MSSTDAITDPFSERRRSLLTDFATVAGSHDADRIGRTWGRHYHELMGARGIFVVEDPKHELILPGDREFGTTGFLRCLMGSTRLLNIQNKDGAREPRYSAPIFCDTNFISFCGTFFSGGDLKANATGFREAVKFLLPIKSSLTANAYVMENADNLNVERVRSSLLGFVALTQATTEDFNQRGSFTQHQIREFEEGVIRFLESMKGADFRTLHGWVKQFYNWSRLILLKCSLIVFTRKGITLETRMHELLRFLHEEFAHFVQFEIYVAYRFFLLKIYFSNSATQWGETASSSPHRKLGHSRPNGSTSEISPDSSSQSASTSQMLHIVWPEVSVLANEAVAIARRNCLFVSFGPSNTLKVCLFVRSTLSAVIFPVSNIPSMIIRRFASSGPETTTSIC